MVFRRFQVRRRERGFLYRDGDFEQVLAPGTHWFFAPFGGIELRRHDTHSPRLVSDDLTEVLGHAGLRQQVEVVDLLDHQRGLVWIDERFEAFLGPGRAAFWKEPKVARVEVIDARTLELVHDQLDSLLGHRDASSFLEEVVVPKTARALLYVNERMDRVLEPGRYAFWKGLARIRVEPMELREQQLDVSGQEILTRDNVTLRVNLVATWRIVDAVKMSQEVPNALQSVYRELQLALRSQVGGRSLEELLAAKSELSSAIRAQVGPQLEGFGAELNQVGIKDVILPGEMKAILNRVIEAEKQSKANLILRREETAATRSLLNTAKLIESNPTLLRLKELEVAERIAEKVGSISIGGGIDELVERFVPKKP